MLYDNTSRYSPSLTIDSARGFRGDVLDDAVDASHFVDDAGGRRGQEIVVEVEVIGGHAVGRCHGAQRTDKIIGAIVAHDADRLNGEEHREGLPDRIIEAGLPDLIEIDR